MNAHTPTTAACTAPADKDPRLSAFMDLEAAVCDLHNMARILSDILEDKMTDTRVPYANQRPDNDWHIHLHEKDMNMISFAWVDVARRAQELEEAFMAAFHAKAE